MLWYQFSLRSLVLLTTFVVVLCSLGVCTYWQFSVIIGICGIAGRIAARRDFGYLVGSIFGVLFTLIAFSLAGELDHVLMLVGLRPDMLLWTVLETVVALIGVIFGGVLGGLIIRKPPGK